MAFRDSTVAQMNGTTALTGTAPTGVASGDRLLAWVVQDNTGHTHTAATGWDATPLAQLTNSGPDGQLATLFEKKNASGSDSYNFTSSSSTRAIVIVAAWSGRDNSAAATVNSSTNTSSNASPISVAISGVTAATNDDLAYFAQLDQTVAGGAWAWSALSGFTEREDSFNNDWISTTLWTNDAVSAGATGTLTATATLAAASAGFSGVVVALPVSGGGSPTTTNVTGSATAGVGIAETYTYTLDASPAGTVTVTPTAPVAGSWSPTTVGLTSGNWNTGLTSDFTASAAGSGNVSSTNDGGLTNDTLAVTVASVSRPSAVIAGSWTDEVGGSLVVADINDASDSTGAKDPAGASYPVLAFTMDTPMAASVSQTCYFRGNDVTAGKQARQVLFANDGTTVVATGAWKTMTGSLATYSDSLTPTATAYKGEIQTQAVPTAVYGVIWPSNLATDGDVRLNWTGSASVSRTAQTIIWKSKYTAQNGYYAVWWRLPDAAATFGATEWYFGTHPFPCDGSVNGAGQATGGTGGSGSVQYAEIATLGAGVDYITSPSAANGGPFLLVADVWVTEAATVEVISGTTLRHTYWPDITNTTSFIRQDRTLASLDTPTAERVVFGGSPWRADTPTAGKTDESASGTFRYWKMFSAALSITDIATEAASESDSAVTTAGIASEFYSNINPTPTDVTDKSGNGHDPAWANSNRPTLYTG